jgi:glycosyltransferase involved in cell wall biosynthesis
MKIVVAHNFYQQPGGEDQVFAAETELLESYGHKPVRFIMHNDEIDGMNRVQLAIKTTWNRDSAARLGEVVKEHKPDVVHFHNTFPLISPAAYSAARKGGAAVVQTLHNFRMLCPNAVFFREGKICESCLGKAIPLPGVLHRCYRGSLAASAMCATTLTAHRALGTWKNAVDLYITPSESARRKFIEGGLPAEKIVVKPHFLPTDPGVGTGDGNYAVFVGRLSFEKGIETLLAAWKELRARLPLKIIGDGPLADEVRDAVMTDPRIEWLGRKSLNEIYDIVGRAKMLIFPSQCYETFGRVAIEAYARGTPVVATDHGAMADVVDQGRTGLRFAPGSPRDLADRVQELLDQPARLAHMREQARREFETKYTAPSNYERLMRIYEDAIARSARISLPLPVLRERAG